VRWAIILLALPVAYAVGWATDVFLNEDLCAGHESEGGPSVQDELTFFPSRTICRLGGEVVERGSATAFYCAFFWTLFAAAMVIAPGPRLLRLGATLVAAVAAFVLVFV
jgi:hypothetical protein